MERKRKYSSTQRWSQTDCNTETFGADSHLCMLVRLKGFKSSGERTLFCDYGLWCSPEWEFLRPANIFWRKIRVAKNPLFEICPQVGLRTKELPTLINIIDVSFCPWMAKLWIFELEKLFPSVALLSYSCIIPYDKKRLRMTIEFVWSPPDGFSFCKKLFFDFECLVRLWRETYDTRKPKTRIFYLYYPWNPNIRGEMCNLIGIYIFACTNFLALWLREFWKFDRRFYFAHPWIWIISSVPIFAHSETVNF